MADSVQLLRQWTVFKCAEMQKVATTPGLTDQSQNPRTVAMDGRNDPSDVSDEQWRILRRLLPSPSRRGRPSLDRRVVLNAIWSVLRTGCQWRALPKDFPKWSSVYTIYRRWKMSGVWVRLHDRLREHCRCR